MIFKFKKKKITIDCFTPIKPIHDLFAPKLAAYYFPEWWKNLPKTVSNSDNYVEIERKHGTMRYCNGFIDWYKTGFIIPMWSELHIKITPEYYKFEFSNGGLGDIALQDLSIHNKNQFGDSFNDFHHCKFIVPWLFKEKSGVNFQLSYPMWNHIDKWKHFHIVPGIINFNDAPQPNVNSFFNKEDNIIKFQAGEPLVYISPLTEKEIEIKTHLVDYNEFLYTHSSRGYILSFSGHKKTKKRKAIEKNNSQKCPFS